MYKYVVKVQDIRGYSIIDSEDVLTTKYPDRAIQARESIYNSINQDGKFRFGGDCFNSVIVILEKAS